MGNQLPFKTKTSYSLKPVKPTVHYVGFPPCFKKKLKFFLVRVRYRPSLLYRLSLVCSKFSAGIQLFGLKTISHDKPDQKNLFETLQGSG